MYSTEKQFRESKIKNEKQKLVVKATIPSNLRDVVTAVGGICACTLGAHLFRGMCVCDICR